MKKIQRDFKLALGSLTVFVLSIASLLIFGLLPLYSIVGDTSINDSGLSSANDNLLHRSGVLNTILIPLIGVSFFTAVTFLIIGLVKQSKKIGS